MEISFAAIVAKARLRAGLTAAEFDYALAQGPEVGVRAYEALYGAVHDLANQGHPLSSPNSQADERAARGRTLYAEHAEAIERLAVEARAKRYTGWSAASRGPIRYAR